MTLREDLEKKLQRDYSKTPKKIWNKNNLEMIWNEEEKLYIGIDSKGEEWITSLQHTTIPIFSISCTNKQRKNNAEVDCAAINFVTILDNNTKCRKCSKEFTIQLTVPKSSMAYEILEKLDK